MGPPRPTGAETKAAIRTIARRQFAELGFGSVGLEEIGHELGITRSAILHHFGSKVDLLREIVEPFEVALDSLFDRHDGPVPLAAAERRRLLGELVAVYFDHREVLAVLLRDGSSQRPLGIPPRMAVRIDRLIRLLAGEDAGMPGRVMVDGVVGVITRVLLDPFVDPDDQAVRTVVLEATLRVARPLGKARATEPGSVAPRGH